MSQKKRREKELCVNSLRSPRLDGESFSPKTQHQAPKRQRAAASYVVKRARSPRYVVNSLAKD
jgi:hypothetical protein